MDDEDRDLWLTTNFFKNLGLDLYVLDNIARFADRMDWDELLLMLLVK